MIEPPSSNKTRSKGIRFVRTLKALRFFYIENDYVSRAIISLILELQGAKVFLHHWGSGDLITYLQKVMPIDIILCDFSFGDGTTRGHIHDVLRQSSEFASIPIIGISSTVVNHTESSRFAGFITKPLRAASLPYQIMAIIDSNNQLRLS